jgi:integrase
MCRGEVGGLRWKDVDLEAGKLSIAQARVDTAIDGVHESAPKTKNRKRTIKLPPYIVQELKEEKRRQKEQQLLFGSRYVKSEYVCRRADGRLYCPSDISRTFHRFLVRNKYSPIRFHDLRHSCASILLSENVPLTVVSAILGHANPQITSSVYAHMLDNGKQVAADALEKIYATQESVKNVSRSEK